MKAILQEPLSNGKTRCNVCAFRCELSPGQVGRCRVRRNDGGQISYLAYDEMTAVCPFVGNCAAGTYCVGKPSCNWTCSFCLSAPETTPELADGWKDADQPLTEDGFLDKKSLIGSKLPLFPLERFQKKTPAQVVEDWKASGLDWFAVRLTEPSIHVEATSEIFRLVKDAGGFVMIGTNGYWTPELVEVLAPLVDLADVGIKGSANARFMHKVAGVPRVEPIFDTIQALSEAGVTILVSDLPVYHARWEDDFGKLCAFIAKHLPERDFPRLTIAPLGGKTAATALGNFKLGIPVKVRQSVYMDSRAALLSRAAHIALDHLEVLWVEGFGGMPEEEIGALVGSLGFPKVREGFALRVARHEDTLASALSLQDSPALDLLQQGDDWSALGDPLAEGAAPCHR